MATWHEITRDPEYQELSEQGKALVKQGFFEREISSDPEFKAFSPQTQKAVFDDFWQTPDDTGEGALRSAASSFARGALRPLSDVPIAVGALTGSEGIERFGKNIQGGIESSFPVNPIQEGFFTTEIPGVAGQITSMLAGGGAGAVGVKALGGTAKAAQLGAKTAVGTQAFAGGTAGGAASADVLGLKGGERIARSLLGGVTELASEAIPFGMGAETGLVRNLLGESVESGAGKILTSGATEAAEEGFAETAGQATDIAFRPEQASMDLSQIGKAMLLGGAGGGLMGAINNIGRPTPPESQTPIQQALAAEINAIPTNNVPPQTEEEKRAGVEAGNPILVDPQGNTAAVAPEMWNEAIKRQITPPVEAQAATQPSDVEARLANLMRNPGINAAVNTADSIVTTAENTSSDVSQATTAARNIIQGVVDTPQPQVAPTELPAVTPSPAMEQLENISQTITDFNGEIAPEMSVLPPTVQAGAGAGEAIQPQPIETAPDAIQEQITDEGLLRQERPEMELQGLGEGNAQPQEVATEGQIQEEVAPPITPQGTPTPATEGTVMPGGSATPPSRGRPVERVVFEKPIKTPIGEIVSYDWQYKVEEVPDKEGEMGLRRFSDWDQAEKNADTGRDIVHQFTVRKPDGTTQLVSLESALGKIPVTAAKGFKAAIKAARRLPVYEAELARLELQQKNRIEAENKARKEGWKNSPPIELRDSGFPSAMAAGARMAWIGDNEVALVDKRDISEDGTRINSAIKSQEIKTEWAMGQIKTPSLSYGEQTRIDNLRRSIKRDKATLKENEITQTQSSSESAQGPQVVRGVSPSNLGENDTTQESPQTTTVAKPTEGAPSQGELTLEETPKQSAGRIKKAMIRFASGMSAIGDLRKGTYARAGHKNYGVGFDVGLLSKNAINELAQIILNLKTQVFIDSGAFSNFKKAIKAPVTGKKVEPLDFDQILAKYDSIISAINQANESEETDYPRPMLVMPDVIGNQAESLVLIEKYKNWIALEVSNDTSIPIIPIPLGELSLSQAYNRILEILGSNTLGIKIDPRRFVVGVPSNAEAISRDDLAKFLSESKPPHIHFLGAAADQNINPLIDVVAENSPTTQVTADASKIRSAILSGVAKGKTRSQAIFDALYQEDDPMVILDSIKKQSTQTTASETETAAPSAKEAAVASVVQQPVEGSIPTVEQESATTAIESTEKADVAKEAMRFLEADLTDAQRAKWTPEMFTAAQAFFDSGGKDFDSLKKAIKFPRVVQQAYLKADKEAAAEQTRREAADAAMAREVEKATKEQAKLEADQKQREELGLKTLNSLIEKTRTNVVQGTVKPTDANQAVAILNRSGEIPNVLFTWIGTSKDFLADPANRVRYPETWAAVSANSKIEGMSENGQPIVFTDNVGVSDLDRNLAKLQGTTPEVAAVRRVILHENIHKGMFFLSLKDKMKLFQFLHRLYSPEELDQLAKSYDEYSDWRINQVSYFSIIEEAMTRDFDSMAEIPRDGIWAEFMQFLRDIWQKITGKTSEPTLKNYKDVFRLIRNSLKNSEAANADRLKNGGATMMSMSEFISNVTPEQDAAYAKAVADGDMETAQRMVDEAAKVAMPKSVVTEPMISSKEKLADKPLLKVYHGTDAQFNVFERGRKGVTDFGFLGVIEGERHGIFFAENKDFANTFAKSKGGDRVVPAFLNITMPFELQDAQSIIESRELGSEFSIDYNMARWFFSRSNKWEAFDDADGKAFVDWLESKGFDGAFIQEEGIGLPDEPTQDVWVALSPNQIKSADPVTYDDAGNVIPLSRRFQSASNDIRFSKVEYDSPNEEFKIPSASKLSDLSSLPFSYTQSEIVSSILSLGFNPSIRVVNEPTFSRAAVYNGSDGIILNFALLDGKPKYALRAIVHESVHDATHAAIRRPENKEIVDRLNDLMAYAKRKFYSNKSKYGGETSAIFHSFENLDEFLTGAFTEKSFRSLLSKLELSERSKLKPSSEEVSVFRKFMELVMELLNMSGNPSILEEVVKSGEALMMSQTSADFPLSRDNRIENIYQPGLVFRGAKASKVTYESPNEVAFNSGAEVARNSDYDERDKAVRSTIREAYDLAPKDNGPSVPLDQLFDIAKQSMPDLTENEFSQILQDLYEDSGALLQAGESPFIVTTPDGQRAGSAIIVSSLPTGAMASTIDPESDATKKFVKDIQGIESGTLKAAFGGRQFFDFEPVEYTVRSNKSYEQTAINYVNNFIAEGGTLEQMANSVIAPNFLAGIGIEDDVMARQALVAEVKNRVVNAGSKKKSKVDKKFFERLNQRISAFWQGVGSKGGRNQGQRAYIIGNPRYSWMFLTDEVDKELKQRRDNILNVQFGNDNATSFTQNSYENADMASTVSADEVAKDTINDTEWDLIKEGEQVFEGGDKTLWERAKALVRRFAFYARAEAAEIKSASKASMTDAERNELNAILTMPKEEREKAKAKDLAEFRSIMAKLLGEESPTDTPTEKKKRNKRKEIIDTVEKRVKAGEPIEAPEEVETSEDEVTKAEATAQAILKDLSERYSDPLIFRDKKPNINEMRELYKERVKQGNSTSQMTEKTFVNKAIELGADEKTAGILWSAAELEIDAREAMRQDKIRQRNAAAGERADAQAHRIIFAKERLKRQSGFADIDTNPNKDTIIKAFREQVKTPIALDAFIQRLIPLKVSRQVAERLFRAAERENTDLAAMAVYDRTQGPKALKRMVSEINLMRRGEEIPLRTPIPWRKLLSQKAKTVEEYRQRIFDAISANEELKSATPEQKARLADLFTEAWESNRKRILDGMLERMIRAEEAKKNLSKEGAKALQEQRMRIVEDINLGIFDNDEIAKIMAEKFGIKSEFTDAEREKIESLIEILQDEKLNRVKRNKAAYELLETLSAQTDIPISKLLANFWVSSVLSGMNTVFSIGMSVFSGMGELTTTLYRIFVSAFSNPKQLPSEVAAAFKTLARVLSATPRQANRAWQYLVTGDQAFLDPTMNDALKNMDYDSIGKNNQLAEQMAKSDKILQKVMGLFMRTVSRLLTALDLFNSGLTKEGSLSLVFRQLNLDPAKIEMLEKKSDLKAYKAQVIEKYFGNVAPKTAREKALVESYAMAEMMKELDELGSVSENADQMAMQGAMTLDPSGIGGYGYRLVKSMMKSAESGTDKLVERNLRKWDEAQGASDKTEAGVKLALSYIFQFAAYNAANLVGVRFARFAGNKFNQSLSFLPVLGALRLFEAEFDADRIRGKEAFTDMIKRNQLTGVMAAAIGYVVLKAIAEEPDDEKRGAFINGGWSNLTPEKKQQKLASGQKEYTLGFGDTVINYGNWPGSGIIAAIGGLSDLIRFSPEQWSEKTVSDKLMSATASGVFSALEVPALSQFQELFGSSLSSKDPNEQKLTKFARVIGNYAGGFVPRILKDIDYLADPNFRKYETLWEKTASHIPVYRRYEGKEYYDILGQQIQRNIYPGSREFMTKPTDPAYKVLGALNSRGIWLTPANAEHRMVGKGARRRSLTQEEADNYSLETGKGYKQMLLRYGQRALQMPTERAKAFLLDKADEVRDRALKKVYRGYQPAT